MRSYEASAHGDYNMTLTVSARTKCNENRHSYATKLSLTNYFCFNASQQWPKKWHTFVRLIGYNSIKY